MGNHGEIDHFEVIATPESGETPAPTKPTATATSARIENLNSFTNYTVQIITVNKPSVEGSHGGQGGDPSEAVSKVTWPARKLPSKFCQPIRLKMKNPLNIISFRWSRTSQCDMCEIPVESFSQLGST